MIDSGQARKVVERTVATFELELDVSLEGYDEDALKQELALLYGVDASAITLSSVNTRRRLLAGGLRLAITITPAEGQDAAELLAEIRATNQDEAAIEAAISAPMQVVTAASTTQVEVEVPSSCELGYWCSAGLSIACVEGTYADPNMTEAERISMDACKKCARLA